MLQFLAHFQPLLHELDAAAAHILQPPTLRTVSITSVWPDFRHGLTAASTPATYLTYRPISVRMQALS